MESSTIPSQDTLTEITSLYEAWDNALRAPGAADNALDILHNKMRALFDDTYPVTNISVKPENISVVLADSTTGPSSFTWQPFNGRLTITNSVPMDVVYKLTNQQNAVIDIIKGLRALKKSETQVELMTSEKARQMLYNRLVQSNGVTTSK